MENKTLDIAPLLEKKIEEDSAKKLYANLSINISQCLTVIREYNDGWKEGRLLDGSKALNRPCIFICLDMLKKLNHELSAFLDKEYKHIVLSDTYRSSLEEYKNWCETQIADFTVFVDK